MWNAKIRLNFCLFIISALGGFAPNWLCPWTPPPTFSYRARPVVWYAHSLLKTFRVNVPMQYKSITESLRFSPYQPSSNWSYETHQFVSSKRRESTSMSNFPFSSYCQAHFDRLQCTCFGAARQRCLGVDSWYTQTRQVSWRHRNQLKFITCNSCSIENIDALSEGIAETCFQLNTLAVLAYVKRRSDKTLRQPSKM